MLFFFGIVFITLCQDYIMRTPGVKRFYETIQKGDDLKADHVQ
jgi:hypothetical protein